MKRIYLSALLFAVLAGLVGCAHQYTEPQPTQPIMPLTVTWGTEQPPQESK